MKDHKEEKLKQVAKRILDEKSQDYDADLVERLALARRHALAGLPQDSSRRNPGFYFAGAVTASVLAILIYFNLPGIDKSEAALLVSDMEMFLEEGEELEMLENEIDFYVWLESQHDGNQNDES